MHYHSTTVKTTKELKAPSTSQIIYQLII